MTGTLDVILVHQSAPAVRWLLSDYSSRPHTLTSQPQDPSHTETKSPVQSYQFSSKIKIPSVLFHGRKKLAYLDYAIRFHYRIPKDGRRDNVN